MKVQRRSVHVPGRRLHRGDTVPSLIGAQQCLLGEVVSLEPVAGQQIESLEEPFMLGEEECLKVEASAASGLALRLAGSIIMLHERARGAPCSVLPTRFSDSWLARVSFGFAQHAQRAPLGASDPPRVDQELGEGRVAGEGLADGAIPLRINPGEVTCEVDPAS